MNMLFKMISVAIVALLWSGCAAAPKIGEQAVNTPEHYTENKVLFVDNDNSSSSAYELKHAYELDQNANLNFSKLSPLGVIIRGVRLPTDLTGRRDVAVVLDLVTAGEKSVTSLVPFYQRDVPGRRSRSHGGWFTPAGY